jgi:hypothetical protein
VPSRRFRPGTGKVWSAASHEKIPPSSVAVALRATPIATPLRKSFGRFCDLRPRHLFCYSRCVQLFEILQDGFHTPLTVTEVAELFHAGRVGRQTPCKPTEQKEWRTVDEFFPLLKYHAPFQFSYQPPESNSEFRFRRAVVVAMCVVGAAATTIVIYLYSQSQNPADRRITAIDSISTSEAPSYIRRVPASSTHPAQNTISAATMPYPSGAGVSPVVIQPVERAQSQTASRSAEGQRILDQAGRDQAVAEQQRVIREQKVREEQKAADRNEHVPFDQWQIANVGGESVRVKIHDNDVTSFDVWIKYDVRREVKKQKGITHSGTDETLIYSNGRASLYYVWEISGRINHCLLRVRDA